MKIIEVKRQRVFLYAEFPNKITTVTVRCGVMVSICRSHRQDRGSIPRNGIFSFVRFEARSLGLGSKG